MSEPNQVLRKRPSALLRILLCKASMNPYKETIITLNHERKTIASIFRVIVKEGYKDSYRNLNAFLAEYNEGLGRR
jgi:hypothetical protein